MVETSLCSAKYKRRCTTACVRVFEVANRQPDPARRQHGWRRLWLRFLCVADGPRCLPWCFFYAKAVPICLTGTLTMPCMDAMATTTTATDCVWSFLAAAGAPEVALAGLVALPEADTDLRPDDRSTGSLCPVSVGKRARSLGLYMYNSVTITCMEPILFLCWQNHF